MDVDAIKMNGADKALLNVCDTKVTKNIVVQTNQSKWRSMSILLTIILLSLMAALLGTTICWRHLRCRAVLPAGKETCVHCDSLHSADAADSEIETILKGMTKTLGENRSICCGETTAVLDKMIKRFTEEKYKEEVANREIPMSFPGCHNGTQTNPTAKVAGIAVNEMQQGADNLTVVLWNTSLPSSVIGTNITYVDGGLVIGIPGYYYVFSQIKISTVNLNGRNVSEVRSRSASEADLTFSHQVYLKSNNGGSMKKILESTKSFCEIFSNTKETTSSVGAIFSLKQNDKVFVKTSHPLKLVPCHHSNYFGLYMT